MSLDNQDILILNSCILRSRETITKIEDWLTGNTDLIDNETEKHIEFLLFDYINKMQTAKLNADKDLSEILSIQIITARQLLTKVNNDEKI